MIAALCGKIEAVDYLLEKGADPSLKGKLGSNLLYSTSVGGNVAIVKMLLSHGLDINSRDGDSSTALTIALAYGKAEAVEYLLSRGAH